MNTNNDGSEPLRISGEIISDRNWDALAVVTDEDVEQIPQTWARTVPERYKYVISADASDTTDN